MLLFPAFSVQAFCQPVDAILMGTVQDADGTMLPGTRITAIHNDTKKETSVLTVESGKYAIFVPPGKYTISAEMGGFHASVKKDVVLEKSSKNTLDFVLQAAPVE